MKVKRELLIDALGAAALQLEEQAGIWEKKGLTDFVKHARIRVVELDKVRRDLETTTDLTIELE